MAVKFSSYLCRLANRYDTAQAKLKFIRHIAAFAILAFGGWTSLRYSFGSWAPDADIAVPVALWQGVIHHGLVFLTTWRYTEDNWLFSLVLPASAIYSLFGTDPKIVIGLGWFIFIVSVAMTSLLAYRIAGRNVAFFVAAVLLYANYWTLGAVGYLAFPVTHNSSMAWGLLTILIALRAIEQKSFVSAAVGGLCIFINSVSDPWAGAAIALPVILTSTPLAWLNRRNQHWMYALALSAATTLAFVAAQTRLFGILDFLPPSIFSMTNAAGLVTNLEWMVRTVGVIFNIVPRTGVYDLPLNFLDFVAVSIILTSALFLTVKHLRSAPIGEQMLCGTMLLSIPAIIVLFLLNLWPTGELNINLGRFFPNLYFFGILLVGITIVRNWERFHITAKITSIVYPLLLVISGLASYPALWTGQAATLTADNVKNFGKFLEENNLSYGYGPYWGSNALAMNWMSGGRVTIRPIVFSSDSTRVVSNLEGSDLWYNHSVEARKMSVNFLIINDADGSCPSVEACVAGAIQQFGSPFRQLAYQGSVVLVWSHQITVDDSALDYIGQDYSTLGDYWYSPARQNWMGSRVSISTRKSPVDVTLTGTPFIAGSVRITVTSGSNQTVYSMTQTSAQVIHVPANTAVTLQADKIFVPANVLHNGDKRNLSILLSFKKSLPTGN